MPSSFIMSIPMKTDIQPKRMKMFKKSTKYSLTALLVLFFVNSATGQTYSHARSLGMAHAYTAVARGVAAPIWNPANLAFRDRPGFNLNLVGAGMLLGNSSFSKSQYDAYVGKYLSPDEVQNILASVPEEGFKLYLDSGVQAIGFAIGAFALTASATGASDLKISKDYLRLVLEGIRWEQSYDIGENSGEAFAYSSITASFAFPILDQIYLGTNASYIIGFGHSNVVESSGQFYNGFESYGDGSVKVRYAQGGSGYSADFGLASARGKWNFGVFLHNAMSKINWEKDTEQFEAFFYTEGSVNVENSADEDSLITHGDETTGIDPFSTTLPKEIRAGLSRKGKNFLLAIDLHQGFSDRPGVSKKPYLGVGTEWQGMRFLPLRLGLGVGGNTGMLMAWGFGLKLGFFRLDFGMNMSGLLSPSRSKALGMAASTSLSF